MNVGKAGSFQRLDAMWCRDFVPRVAAVPFSDYRRRYVGVSSTDFEQDMHEQCEQFLCRSVQ